MVANIRGYTPNYSFKLINFDTPRWHTLEYSNWGMVDALLLQSGIPQVRGGWQNNASYLVGDRVFDEDTSATYRCLVAHTSAISGTFAEDRLLHPTYWSLQLAGVPIYRDVWLPSVAYVLGDIVVVDDYAYYLCTLGHTSSADFPTDALKWQKVFDATVVVADAEAAKDAAYQFSLDAQGSATDAANSAIDAQLAEDSAETWADEARAATGGFRWAFSSDTAAVDPAVGRVAFNNNDPTLVTEMYVSALSAEVGNPDVSDWLVTWDDSTNVDTRGTIQIRKVGAPEQFLLFQLTGSIVDNGSWLKFTVSYALHSGTVTNGEQLSLGFVRAGDVGPTGTGGGDMLRSNNLSDVVSVPTSRNNLGLGTSQIPTFSQVLLGNEASAPMHAATKGYVDGSPSLYVSDTPPAGVLAGSLWWDSDRGTLFVYYNDGSSTQWVQAVATPGMDTSPLVKKAGDTMTGLLTLSGDPTADLHAVPKRYLTAQAAPLFNALADENMIINGCFDIRQLYGDTSTTGGWPPGTPAAVDAQDMWTHTLLHAGGTVNVSHAYFYQFNPGGGVDGYFGYNQIYQEALNMASVGANDYSLFYQVIEDRRMYKLRWGETNPLPMTVAFWFYSNVVGKYNLAAICHANTASYVAEFNYSVAATWQRVVIVFPGAIIGTWASGLRLSLTLASGTTFQTSANTWAAGQFFSTAGSVNFHSTGGNTLSTTGWVAIPGSHPSLTAEQQLQLMRDEGREMLLCQRYFQVYPQMIVQSDNAINGYRYESFTFPRMRAVPTVLIDQPTYSQASSITINTIERNNAMLTLSTLGTGVSYAVFRLHLNARL